MKNRRFDYVIVGAGAAGLHLALAMNRDPFFSDKKIIILDKAKKEVNDRTWCYWEKGAGLWEQIIHKVWEAGTFITSNTVKQLDMDGYRYKMVKSIDFYNHAKHIISQADNIEWKTIEVMEVNENEGTADIVTKNESISAVHVFDSRIDSGYFNNKESSVGVLQHFKGWEIQTEEDVFNESEFVMMDFRVKLNNLTGFTYVLPFGKRNALIEFTLFSKDLVDDSVYELMLNQYIREIIGISRFNIQSTEYGVIPMTDYPFKKLNSKRITKIGTAGGWVKPSSGYSFKNAERFSRQIVNNIKSGKLPSYKIAEKRHRKYDTLFLDILENQNELGEEMLTSMYLNNSVSQIFKFLDEETSILEDIKIIHSFRSKPFREALMKHWRNLI